MVIKYSLFLPLGGQQTPKRATSSLFRARSYIKTHPPQPPLLRPGGKLSLPGALIPFARTAPVHIKALVRALKRSWSGSLPFCRG